MCQATSVAGRTPRCSRRASSTRWRWTRCRGRRRRSSGTARTRSAWPRGRPLSAPTRSTSARGALLAGDTCALDPSYVSHRPACADGVRPGARRAARPASLAFTATRGWAAVRAWLRTAAPSCARRSTRPATRWRCCGPCGATPPLTSSTRRRGWRAARTSSQTPAPSPRARTAAAGGCGRGSTARRSCDGPRSNQQCNQYDSGTARDALCISD